MAPARVSVVGMGRSCANVHAAPVSAVLQISASSRRVRPSDRSGRYPTAVAIRCRSIEPEQTRWTGAKVRLELRLEVLSTFDRWVDTRWYQLRLKP